MGRIIAYIEDDQDMIDLVSIILERHDYQVAGFVRSEGVVESMRDINPSLILLDIMMPHVDGFEVYHKLKEADELRQVPIIVISAMKKAVEEIEMEGKIEVEGCLVKPFSINDLVAVIKEVLPERDG
jgi:DNA-binding response OmpR family regulator